MTIKILLAENNGKCKKKIREIECISISRVFWLGLFLNFWSNYIILLFFVNSDEEDEDKNDELDAEEGKADENIDEDFWAGEDENEQNDEEQKEDENLDKTGIHIEK